jgi:ribonuclease BN (tRNA processing enzyme)
MSRFGNILRLFSSKDARVRGHSSAEMAGNVARRVKAQVLALNHLSGGVGARELRDLVREAEEANGGVSRVIPSYDFMELVVPRFGFEFEKENMFERFINNESS